MGLVSRHGHVTGLASINISYIHLSTTQYIWRVSIYTVAFVCFYHTPNVVVGFYSYDRPYYI